MTEKPYTAATLAERWGVSSTHVYNLLQSGELAGFKIGSKLWRIKPEAVEAYEQRHAEPELPLPDPDKPKVGKEVRDAAARLARLRL